MAADFKKIFEAVPTGTVVLEAKEPFNLIAITDYQLNVVKTTREAIINKPLFETFPEPVEFPNKVRSAIEKVIETKTAVKLELLRYDIPDVIGATEKTKYWTCEYLPILCSTSNEVTHILVNATDITEAIKSGAINMSTFD